MQHENFPLFILLLAATYLAIIYSILKVAELAQQENLFRQFNSNTIKNSITYTNTIATDFLSKWNYNLLKNGNYQQKKLG